jgi:hypothetical protein
VDTSIASVDLADILFDDFQGGSIPLSEAKEGQIEFLRDAIKPIYEPEYGPVSAGEWLDDADLVIGYGSDSGTFAYPLRLLDAHEIVNDLVDGVPVAVTYCPLCNAAIVFDARIDGKATEFGTTGKLRNSDLVMYDRNTESWWQQFLGEAIVGDLTGKKLKMLPSRIESIDRFKKRFPKGKVLVPAFAFMGAFGANPYAGYDTSPRPFLYNGSMPKGIEPLARVVAVDKEAWSLGLLRKKKRIVKGDLVLTWEAGQNSALDTRDISKGRDVGNVVVRRKTAKGLTDEVHDITFAFAFHAFRPEGTIHMK